MRFGFRYRKRRCCRRLGGAALRRCYLGPGTNVPALTCLNSISVTGRLLRKRALCVHAGGMHVSSPGDVSNCGRIPVNVGRRMAMATIKINDHTCPMGVMFRSGGKGACCRPMTVSGAGYNVTSDSFVVRGGGGCFPGSFDFDSTGAGGSGGLVDGCKGGAICLGTRARYLSRASAPIELPQCARFAVGGVVSRGGSPCIFLRLRGVSKGRCGVGTTFARADMISIVLRSSGCFASLFNVNGLQAGCPGVARRI